MLTQTSPNKVGPIGILALFKMVYLVFLGLISSFLYGVYRVFSIGKTYFQKDQPSLKKQYRTPDFFLKYSAALAFAPISLIAKQSTGGVGVFEIILLAIIEIIALFYISKR